MKKLMLESIIKEFSRGESGGGGGIPFRPFWNAIKPFIIPDSPPGKVFLSREALPVLQKMLPDASGVLVREDGSMLGVEINPTPGRNSFFVMTMTPVR